MVLVQCSVGGRIGFGLYSHSSGNPLKDPVGGWYSLASITAVVELSTREKYISIHIYLKLKPRNSTKH